MAVAQPFRSLGVAVATGLCALAAGCSDRNASTQGGQGRMAYAFPLDAPPLEPMMAVNAFPLLNNFERPVFLTHPPDGTDRVFVVEQPGRIRVMPNSDAVTDATVFLDITARVTANTGEMGLLGLAFDPDYATSGKFYVYYMRANPLQSVLAEFQVTADPAVADPNSERVLLVVPQPFTNHNSGMLAFGPDNLLYVSVGDGGGAHDPINAGQDLMQVHGSLLRIDPQGSTGGRPYGIPGDNPFVSTPGAWGEIWAYGLRNPWRFSFDRETGELWLADVGQGAREEVNLVAAGDNLGWPVYEGNLAHNNPMNLAPGLFEAPVLAYDRSQGESVTGGYVYRGNRLPELRGAYVYGDFVSGNVWALRREGGGVQNTLLAQVPQLTSFGEDRDGELYAVSHPGALYEFEPATPGSQSFPRTLSATGLFDDTATLTPAEGLIEYESNAGSAWDGAHVRRFLAAPIEPFVYVAEGPWSLPVGSILVKHFELGLVVGDPASRKRLETRVLVHEAERWGSYLYRWNEAGTDADLLGVREWVDLTIVDPAAAGGQRVQRWTFPSRTDCRQCHVAGAPIGVRSEQLFAEVGVNNQVFTLAQLGVLTGYDEGAPAPTVWPDPFAMMGTTEERARSWLQVNCAHCHRPGGTTPGALDLRYVTPTNEMGVVNVRPSGPDLGLGDPWLVRPGNRADSVLYLRIMRRDELGMPPLGSHLVDDLGAELVGLWIDGL